VPNDNGSMPPAMRPNVATFALAGLTATPKTLPAMLFYDEEGCRLFYEITRLPEYYLTRTETALLQKIAREVVPDGFDHGALVEFGGSDETKARILLDQPGTPFNTYV
jgi:L-histidine Nalpha-methyltransferase